MYVAVIFTIHIMTNLSFSILIPLFSKDASSGISARMDHPRYLVTAKAQTSDLTLH